VRHFERFPPPAAIAPGVLCAALLFAPLAGAVDEVQVHGVANFRGSSEGECSASSHSVHTKTANTFAATFNTLKNSGKWDQVIYQHNKSTEGRYWKDTSKSPTGNDDALDKGVDETDIAYIHTHGSSDQTNRNWVSLLMGNNSTTCSIHSNSLMLWGANAASDLDIMVAKACQAGQYEVFVKNGFFHMRTSTSPLSMWNSFHGDSSCGNFVNRYVEDYADHSVYDGAGENWLDEAYDNRILKDRDDCPTSVVFGSSKSARTSMFKYGGWKDRKDTGNKTGATMWYISKCDPDNGMKLP